MKRLILAACLIVATVATAASLRPARLPRPEHADTEVSQSYGYDFASKPPSNLKLDLECGVTPSNNVELAFGKDVNRDGILGAEESALIVGWDCGKWVARGFSTDTNGTCVAFHRIECPAATTNTLKRLTMDVGLRHSVPKSLTAAENGVAVFTALEQNPPRWFFDRSWDTVRITVRGVDAPEERAKVKVRISGTLVILR